MYIGYSHSHSLSHCYTVALLTSYSRSFSRNGRPSHSYIKSQNNHKLFTRRDLYSADNVPVGQHILLWFYYGYYLEAADCQDNHGNRGNSAQVITRFINSEA